MFKLLFYLHLLTFQTPIFNKPHNHLFLGFYYSALYLTVKNVKSIVRNFASRWSNFVPCLIINLQVEDEMSSICVTLCLTLGLTKHC